MKKHYKLLLFLIANSLFSSAQITEIASGMNRPFDLQFVGNELYISEFFGEKISKIDVTQSNPTVEEVVIISSQVRGTTVKGNDLYLCYGTNTNGTIAKVDITATTPTKTEIVTGLGRPHRLVFYGNDLYFTQNSSGKISKIDITETNPVITDVVTGLSYPSGLAISGNFLYFTQYISSSNTNKISKIDLSISNSTPQDVITNTIVSPHSLLINGNNFFIGDISLHKIFKIDITVANPTLTEVVNQVFEPNGLAIQNSELYFTSTLDNTISKISLSTLSVDNVNATIQHKYLYPNPSDNFIKISGVEGKEKYTIFNVFGKKVKTGKISNNENITIENWSKGLYFIKIDNKPTMKFIKK